VPVVTALRETRSGRVAVDLDGARWRTLPVDVVARVGLVVGEDLDRERLRELARELRRSRALDAGLRALAQRDLSSDGVRRRLARRGVRMPERDEAVGRLAAAGLVDDARYAVRRAESLAARGYGDEAIRWRLAREGLAEDIAAGAVERLPSELVRADRLVEARGRGAATARELARRGFGEEAIEAALGAIADEH
jgi:SOS response regulatory protein OraA/RecX